jgi:hypothetical protein
MHFHRLLHTSLGTLAMRGGRGRKRRGGNFLVDEEETTEMGQAASQPAQPQPQPQQQATQQHDQVRPPDQPPEELAGPPDIGLAIAAPADVPNAAMLGAARRYETLWSSGREAHFAVPHHHAHYHHSHRQFGFIGVRLVQFNDSKQILTWCSCCSCGAGNGVNPEVFSGRDFLDAAAADVFPEGIPAACLMAQALERAAPMPDAMAAIGEPLAGWAALLATRSPAASQGAEARPGVEIVPLEQNPNQLVDHVRFTAVLSDPADFNSWAVLDAGKEPSSTPPLCQGCSSRRRHCPHVAALDAPRPPHGADASTAAGAGNSKQEQWEARLKAGFEEGMHARKLTSLSRLAIRLDDPRVREIMRQRKELKLGFPDQWAPPLPAQGQPTTAVSPGPPAASASAHAAASAAPAEPSSGVPSTR